MRIFLTLSVATLLPRLAALLLLICTTLHAATATADPAPFIDSAAIKQRFSEISAQDMQALRSKRILFASRSFGLNLHNGLTALAKADAKYDLLSSYQRYDLAKAGGDLSIIPADAFSSKHFVHFLATYWPHTKRVEEMDRLLRDAPQQFGKTVDAVVIFYHTALPGAFPTYATKMDALHRDFPNIRFIYVTAGFMGPAHAADNENAHQFSELVRARYRGREPVYDLGAILSDDFRVGHVYCPEYSKDPADVHPNLPAGEAMMAKGFLLVLRDAFKRPATPADLPPLTAAGAGGATAGAGGTTAAPAPVEHLPATHPDAKAVRRLLDANGLTQKQVDAISVVKNGRIVALYLQEAGVRELTADIGVLDQLETLHVYADRNLPLAHLEKISPAIAKCSKLSELLLTANDLQRLPDEITKLQALRTLSIADNALGPQSATVTAWLKKFDAKGAAQQRQ